MAMPRFGIKSLLISCAVIALWLSTFGGYLVGADVRDSILLVAYLAALLAAICNRGRRRIFWIGFFSVLPAFAILPNTFGSFFAPDFHWVDWLLGSMGIRDFDQPNDYYNAVVDTCRAIWLMLMSTIVGWIGTRIYDHSQKSGQ
jgi:hypothetical protein